MSQIFIHIGLPKTATTFMQFKVFPAFTGIHQLQKAKAVSIDDLVRTSADKFLISSEHLLACPFEPKDKQWHQEFENNLVNLARIFPNARIILSLTTHKSLLTSYYKEFISKPRPHYMNIEGFFDSTENDNGFLAHKDISFSNILGLIESHFSQKPFIFLQSEIRNNFDGLIKDLAGYFDEPVPAFDSSIHSSKVNEGVKYYQSKLLISLNRFNNILDNIPLVPTLYNPLFMKLGINPDRICRIHLKSLANKPLELTAAQQDFVEKNYAEDWNLIGNYLNNNRDNFKQ